MRARGNGNGARSGYALMMALMAVVVTMASMALVASQLRHRTWLLEQDTRAVQLSALADAGVALALAQLSINPSFEGQPQTTLGKGWYTVEVFETGRTGFRAVVVQADFAGGRRVVEAVVNLNFRSGPRVESWRRRPRS